MGVETAIAAAGALAAVYSATRKPSIPSPAEPAAPPQATKTPDASTVQQDMSGTGQAGGAPGVAQTMLTGPGGVDPNSLTLGKNTLLGS